MGLGVKGDGVSVVGSGEERQGCRGGASVWTTRSGKCGKEARSPDIEAALKSGNQMAW